VLFQNRGNCPFELGCCTSNRLVGAVGMAFNHHRIAPNDIGFERALKFIGGALALPVFVCQVRLYLGNVLTKAGKRVFHYGSQVVCHFLASVNVVVGVQQNLHERHPSQIFILPPPAAQPGGLVRRHLVRQYLQSSRRKTARGDKPWLQNAINKIAASARIDCGMGLNDA
jgi:hypothetical protein